MVANYSHALVAFAPHEGSVTMTLWISKLLWILATGIHFNLDLDLDLTYVGRENLVGFQVCRGSGKWGLAEQCGW